MQPGMTNTKLDLTFNYCTFSTPTMIFELKHLAKISFAQFVQFAKFAV